MMLACVQLSLQGLMWQRSQPGLLLLLLLLLLMLLLLLLPLPLLLLLLLAQGRGHAAQLQASGGGDSCAHRLRQVAGTRCSRNSR
jgi:hypothetical protein